MAELWPNLKIILAELAVIFKKFGRILFQTVGNTAKIQKLKKFYFLFIFLHFACNSSWKLFKYLVLWNSNFPNFSSHSGSEEVDFLSLLEKEEADFAEQIKKQKAFLHGVFKDKEELAQLCVTQSNKLSKLENERMEWQRKIIEAEREKRDYLERLDGEQQAHR